MPIRYEIQRVRVNPDQNTVIVTGSTVTGLANLGTGVPVFDGMSGTTGTFNTLSGGTGANVYEDGNGNIVIES